MKVSNQIEVKNSQIVCCEDIHWYKGVGWSYNMIGKGVLITWKDTLWVIKKEHEDGAIETMIEK